MDDPRNTPLRLDLQRDKCLVVQFADGLTVTFPLALLRKACPCASCKTLREQQAAKPRGLTVLPAGFVSGPPTVSFLRELAAELPPG
jgi:hypothetical protein